LRGATQPLLQPCKSTLTSLVSNRGNNLRPAREYMHVGVKQNMKRAERTLPSLILW
jgi:hypothetical protein